MNEDTCSSASCLEESTWFFSIGRLLEHTELHGPLSQLPKESHMLTSDIRLPPLYHSSFESQNFQTQIISLMCDGKAIAASQFPMLLTYSPLLMSGTSPAWIPSTINPFLASITRGDDHKESQMEIGLWNSAVPMAPSDTKDWKLETSSDEDWLQYFPMLLMT